MTDTGEKMKISLVIPMYNESGIIADTARTLSEYMSKSFDDYEILFSDDGSTDGCGDIVRDMALPCVRVVGYSQNRGKGSAVRHGVDEAEGELIMFTDADLAYGTDVIGRYYEYFSENRPAVIIGSRNLDADGYEGYTLMRRLASKIYIKVLCIIGGFKLSDSQCGCKAFSCEAAKDIFGRCTVDGFAFDFEAILWAGRLGYSISELPVKIINHRESKVNVLRDSVRMLKDLMRIKRSVRKTKT